MFSTSTTTILVKQSNTVSRRVIEHSYTLMEARSVDVLLPQAELTHYGSGSEFHTGARTSFEDAQQFMVTPLAVGIRNGFG